VLRARANSPSQRIEAGRNTVIAGLCESPLTCGDHDLARRVLSDESFCAM